MSPSAATSAVMSTGRSRKTISRQNRLIQWHALFAQLVDVGHLHHPIEHGDAEKGDETDGRRNRKIQPAEPQRHETPDHGKRNREQNQRRLSNVSEGQEQKQEDETDDQRHHHCQASHGPLLIFELPSQVTK